MFYLFNFLAQLVNVLMILIFIRILMSWVAPRANWYNQPLRTLHMVTESVMAPVRSLIPPIGGLDLSPMLLFFLLGMLQRLFLQLAYSAGG